MTEAEIAHYLSYTLFVIPAAWGALIALAVVLIAKGVTNNHTALEDM